MRYQLHPDHRASGTLALDAGLISARDRLESPRAASGWDQTLPGLGAPCFSLLIHLLRVNIEKTIEKKIQALGPTPKPGGAMAELGGVDAQAGRDGRRLARDQIRRSL